MKRQQRRAKKWEVLSKHQTFETSMSVIRKLRKRKIRCFSMGFPTKEYLVYVHPNNFEDAKAL